MWWMVLVGVVTGMRSMTALAVLCWFSWLGLMPETGWASWSGTAVAAILFGVCALGEYAGDISPRTPSRTSAFPLIVRLVLGAVAGALCAHALVEPTAGGAVFGVAGVLIGAFGGVRLRVWLASKVGRDWPVGISESAVALGLAVLAAMMVHHDVVQEVADVFVGSGWALSFPAHRPKARR
jgi:uncharacterized membrane protein